MARFMLLFKFDGQSNTSSDSRQMPVKLSMTADSYNADSACLNSARLV